MHLPPIYGVLLLALAGCTSTGAKSERAVALQNSRSVEEQRMRAADRGEAASPRGAAVLVPDYTKTFDAGRSSTSALRGYSATPAATKAFYIDRKPAATQYAVRDFQGSKLAGMANEKFATKEVTTRGKYVIPNAAKTAETKTLAVNDARESSQTAGTRELPNAHRQYLGKENDKLHTAVDPTNPPTFSNELHEIKTVDDVRELLNKNK